MSGYTLEPAERLKRARALERDYEAFLAPGERILVSAELTAQFIYAQLVLERADKRFKLDLEAAFTSQDAAPGQALPDAEQGLDLLLDYLRLQLYEFFRSDRSERFHADWRTYPQDEHMLRFRGVTSSPRYEQEATELINAQSSPLD